MSDIIDESEEFDSDELELEDEDLIEADDDETEEFGKPNPSETQILANLKAAGVIVTEEDDIKDDNKENKTSSTS